MATTEVIDFKDALAKKAEADAQNAASIDTDKLTDQERILLNTEQDIPENISMVFQVPEYIDRMSVVIQQTIHHIFPNATPEQLEEVKNRVAHPVRNLLADIAYYNHAAVHRGLEHVRKEHVLQPPTRYTLDFSICAVQSLLNGVIPGHYEHICLTNSGENLEEWTRDIPDPKDIPVDGIPARFIIHNQIYTGKLCFFSYLSENGDSHVISDIITFWANELQGFVHTFRIGYWQEIDPLTGKFKPAPVVEAAEPTTAEDEGVKVELAAEGLADETVKETQPELVAEGQQDETVRVSDPADVDSEQTT